MRRAFNIGIFDPSRGGDPLLFQHLFWFYSHPAVYIMILPAMGVVSEVIACFTRKRIFGYSAMATASYRHRRSGIPGLGPSHVRGRNFAVSALVFSLLSYFVAVPSAVKVFNWTATMYKGSIYFDTPMLYAFGFIGLFTIGGLTGLFLACLGVDVHVHRYLLRDSPLPLHHGRRCRHGLSRRAALLVAENFRSYVSRIWGRLAALIVFLGFNLTFFPQFVLGYLGMPRRYWQYPQEFQVLNILSTAGATILAVGYVLPMIYFVWSMRYGKIADGNPWHAAGLEWMTPSPPPTFNFDEDPGCHLGSLQLRTDSGSRGGAD